MNEKTTNLSWEVKFPLLTNPHILKAWLKAMGLTYLFCMIITGAVLIGTGEAEGLPMIAFIFLIVIICFTLAGFVIMLVIFGNSSKAKFELSSGGATYESIDNKARMLSRMAVVAGGVLGSPAAAGAGLLSISGERVTLKWETVFKAVYDKKHSTIRLRNQYRDLLHLYCTPETYESAKETVMARVAQKDGEAAFPDERSPLPGAFLSTFLVILACMPLYALVDIAKLHLMIPLLIMVFSLAMVWMISLFAWVVLPLMAYIPIHLGLFMSGTSTMKLVSTYKYYKYELIDAGEWIIIALAAAGIFYLTKISLNSLKGKYVPLLMRDHQNI